MICVGICDDGRNVCASLENMLMQYASEKQLKIDVSVWYTGEGLKNFLASDGYLDIVFLDIELISMTGIEVGDYIRDRLDNMRLQIVYISGVPSYAQQLFKTQPLDFLVKPISQMQITEVMDRAIRNVNTRKERFEFQQGKEHYYLPMGDIVYFESDKRKIKIVTAKKSFEFYGKLKDVAKRLPRAFILIHQSYIINSSYVYRYTYELVELVNGTMLTISPANRKQVRERLLREE